MRVYTFTEKELEDAVRELTGSTDQERIDRVKDVFVVTALKNGRVTEQ